MTIRDMKLRGANPRILRRQSAVHLEDVYKAYGLTVVLDNIDLSVPKGEFVCLVGPSGCGKSTLLRLILGQERPTSGILNIHGEPAQLADSTRGIVYQRYSLYPHLTVIGNIMAGPRYSRTPWGFQKDKAVIRDKAFSYLKTVGLSEDDAGKYPHELSGGMRQRVAIAQSLIVDPKILLMDEPFGALDPNTRESTQVFLLKLWEELKMTIFFVTHDLEEAVYLATRLLVLSQYYSDARGDDVSKGAKIVKDLALSPDANPTSVKEEAWFGETIQKIRKRFDPKDRIPIEQFNLSHPASFQTYSPDELKL